MSSKRLYIDGQAGTTALQVSQLLEPRTDIELVRLPDSVRKDAAARQDAIQNADFTILCLPDEAARQSAKWAEAAGTRVIDASTAHRVESGWDYGIPELGSAFRQAIRHSAQVANPGCYPSAVILALRPLIDQKLLSPECPLAIHALSGYSGGGRSMIEMWEDPASNLSALGYSAPYALDRVHKHIPEMMKYSLLQCEPQFLPRVGPFFNGMRVEIPLHAKSLESGNIFEVLADCYRDEPFIEVSRFAAQSSDHFTFDPTHCNGTNRIELMVCEHASGHLLLVAILDNLGKGASGAAVQCLNLMMDAPEGTGLNA